MTATAEIIAIGSELTWGMSLDTNSHWLSLRLAEMGIEVAYHTTVADTLPGIVDALDHAATRADLVIVTGGLGPTADDLTREAMATMAGVELVVDDSSLTHIEGMFQRRGRTMPERNRVQALFPQGSSPIPNPHGTAPGIWLERPASPERGATLYIALPGVPREMKPLFDEAIRPRLAERFGTGLYVIHKTLRCYGAGESRIEEQLGDLTRRGRAPEVGITASEATISLRVTAKGRSREEADALALKDIHFIHQQLGDIVFGAEEDELQTTVARLLSQRNKTLATAESCTGGLVGHLLTEVSGISAHYLGGVVSYSNAAKTELLGVPAELIERHGAVSPEVAQAMATGCRARFGSDLSVGITGIAGPGGGTETKPVGLVYVGLAHEGGIDIAEYNWAAERSSVKLRSAKTALNLVRLCLLKP
ncbi:Putative competence-damage inducible protein [Planctomycetes bacterium Pan216]|uniref:CinA-like protein n=1 Tax=Kolteria novifilia TaxID=2527975 RepID=A0A518B6T8_9BACT|nr:Putative competence-damage inducible protein [Planctomycetes bacterium Pan216]